MAYSDDELAGIVQLFGALTRDELETAVAELAFRRGDEPTTTEISTAVRDALASYGLVPIGRDPEVVVAGPTAFPTLPDAAEDLPHVMDVERESPPRATVAEAVGQRLEDDVAVAIEQGDDAELARLLDVTYEVEAWGPVDLGGLRDRIDGELA